MNHTSEIEQCILISSIVEILNQGEKLLIEIDDASYVRRVPVAFNASIGGHYRHCLDHFRSLLGAARTGDLNYDQRERNPLVENDRFAALNATRLLRSQYEQLEAGCLERLFRVTSRTSYSPAAGSPMAVSTVSREIMYVVAHAVHHYALIGIMGGLMELKLPDGFGVAPSTLKHQAALAKN